MKLIFGDEFIFYTSSMYKICAHCHWLGFSSFKISDPGDLMLNIPLMRCILKDQFSYFIYQQAKFKYTALWAAECLSSVKMAKMKIDTFPSLVFAQ